MAENIILRDYQHEPFKFLNSDFEKLVLAMCPSSGKTETVIYYIDQLFKQKKDLKVLILPHSTNVLLNNFYDRLQNRNVNFTYSTDTSVNCNVHIVLPQSKTKIKDEYDLLIVDEAHENYFADTVQDIIIKTKPKKQILLTGTPYKFIGKDDFKIHFLALNELDKNTIPKLRVDIIESNYQWNGNYNSAGEIKKQFDFKNDDTKITLDKTFKFILNRNNSNKKSLSKTLIICNNIKQSEFVKSYLDSIGLYSVLSNSKNDTKSLLVQDFKHNKINILIVVNRARLGYDDVDLINLIDMSGTLNPNLIYQMIARVLRGSNDVQKYYIRLTSKKDESLNSEIATSVALMLTDKKYISVFNGKNINSHSIIVPNYFSKKYVSNTNKFKKNSPKLLAITEDIISFYRDTICDIEKKSGVYKFCKIQDVLSELSIKIRMRKSHSLESCKENALKYKTRVEWSKNDPSFYSWSLRYNYMEECCKHMESKNINTLDSCIESASKYSTKAEWQRGDSSAFFKAKTSKWFDVCCKHMISNTRTLDECLKIASKYKLKSSFKKNNLTVYYYAFRKGWLEECCKHMENDLKIFNRTFEDCLEEALKHKTVMEWIKSSATTYSKASKEKWLEECCKHMDKQHIKKIDVSKITLKDCVEDASKYATKTDWERNSWSIFYYAKKNNWLNECLKKTGKIKIDLTLEDCIKEASKYRYTYEWIKADHASFNTAKKNNWLEECAKHFILSLWNRKITKQICKEEALKYNTRTEWFKSSQSTYSKASKEKWLEECCEHMIKFTSKYTLETCKEIASKFDSKMKWAKGDSKSYYYANKKKWLDECCKHMIPLLKKRTLESCKESASKFTNFTNWKKGDTKSYKYAERMGWYQECRKHFKK